MSVPQKCIYFLATGEADRPKHKRRKEPAPYHLATFSITSPYGHHNLKRTFSVSIDTR